MPTIDQKVDDLTTRVGQLLDLIVGKVGLFGGGSSSNSTVPQKRIANPDWAPTMILNWSQYDVYRITLGGNTTFVHSGGTDGQNCLIELKQDGIGGRLVDLSSSTHYSTDLPIPVLSTSANTMDRIGLVFSTIRGQYDLVAFIKGY